MDLKSFASLGRIKREFEILKDLKVEMHTLAVLEQQNALAEVPVSPLGSDPAFRTVILQQALIIYAIDSINGEKITREQAKEFVQSLQAPVFNEIYNNYDLMAQEQNPVLAELKKK